MSTDARVAQDVCVRIREDAVVMRRHGDELVLYEYLVGGFYLLNQSARMIVEAIDGRRSAAEIAAHVAAASGGSIAASDVAEVLDALRDLHVLEPIGRG